MLSFRHFYITLLQDEHLNVSSGENFWIRSSKAASPLPNLDCRAASPLPNLDCRAASPLPNLDCRATSPLPNLDCRATSPLLNLDCRATSPLPNLDGRTTSPLPNLDRRASSPPTTINPRTPSPLLPIPDQGSASKIQKLNFQKLTPIKTSAGMLAEFNIQSNSTPVVKPTERISSAGNTLFSSREERVKVQETLMLNIVENGTEGLGDKNKPILQRPLIEELD